MNSIIKTEEILVDGFSFPMYRTESGELVMADLDIGMALGLAQPINVRKVIRAHTVELVEGGALFSRQERSGGRVGLAFFLTESQALYIAAKCRTKAAAAQLKRLISVYMLARKGDGAGAVAAAGGSTKSPRLSGGDDDGSMLIASIEANLQLARQHQQTRAELAEVAARQAGQDLRLGQLETVQRAALREVSAPASLPVAPELPGISLRQRINKLVHQAAVAGGTDTQQVWRQVYSKLKDHYRYDAYARSHNRGLPKLDVIEQDGKMDCLAAIVQTYIAAPARQLSASLSHARIGHA